MPVPPFRKAGGCGVRSDGRKAGSMHTRSRSAGITGRERLAGWREACRNAVGGREDADISARRPGVAARGLAASKPLAGTGIELPANALVPATSIGGNN